jgi:hypothetical protein
MCEKATMDEVVDPEAVCYLCLDVAGDESDQPLRRDCACRGTDAGFVHLACLTEYTATKSMQASGVNEFINPWKLCPGCHQECQNELAVDIAAEFVSFIRRQYPDTQRQVEALNLKLRAFDSMLDRLQPVQKREAGVIANVLISLIDRMKADAPRTYRYSQIESFAYHIHGRIALDEGTEESARRAAVHFHKDLKVCEAIGDADGIAIAKQNIALAKSKYEDDNNYEELSKASREVYELRIAEYGEDDEYTIHAGKDYAIALWQANRGEEAMELLTKLLITSKQVLGPHHNTTKDIESELKQIILKIKVDNQS